MLRLVPAIPLPAAATPPPVPAMPAPVPAMPLPAIPAWRVEKALEWQGPAVAGLSVALLTPLPLAMPPRRAERPPVLLPVGWWQRVGQWKRARRWPVPVDRLGV